MIVLMRIFSGASTRGTCGLFVLGLMIALGSGCQGPTTTIEEDPGLVSPTDHVYTLGPGDRIRVIVFGQPDLSGDFEVDSVGRIALPLIRGVDAEGLSVPALEKTITSRLEANFFADPKVSIELIKTRPFCVLGEVRNPGCFSYAYGMRAAMAIAVAGGYTYRAKENDFVVSRADGSRFQGRHETAILPGDVIEVSERFF